MTNKIIKLFPDETKDGECRKVPICKKLFDIFRSIARHINDDHVFIYNGKIITDIRKGLTRACYKSGIPYGRYTQNGFMLHDLRHTFNTNMRKAGVPESVIMKITGHSTREMFDRYNTVDSEDALAASKKLELFLESIDQNVYRAVN